MRNILWNSYMYLLHTSKKKYCSQQGCIERVFVVNTTFFAFNSSQKFKISRIYRTTLLLPIKINTYIKFVYGRASFTLFLLELVPEIAWVQLGFPHSWKHENTGCIPWWAQTFFLVFLKDQGGGSLLNTFMISCLSWSTVLECVLCIKLSPLT